MNRRLLIAGVLLMIIGAGGCMTEPTVEERVAEGTEDLYVGDKGRLYAYPGDPSSEVLSESIGQYMEFLVRAHDKERFYGQIQVLKSEFLEENEAGPVLRWRADRQTRANALIDDVRVISALRAGGRQFEDLELEELAGRLSETIASTQVMNGYMTDFLDWHGDQPLPAPTVTLSYLTPQFFEAFPDDESNRRLLEKLPEEHPFFPETYDIPENDWKRNSEVHMVDQLLIAGNRHHLGIPSPNFEEWLKNEWTTRNRLFGRYGRETLTPEVEYEALSVYALAAMYFNEIDEPALAKEVVRRSDELVANGALEGAHYFDYSYYWGMKMEQRQEK